MNVLVIGSGGREHALAWAIARSPLLGRLYCAPGNPGMARHGECVALDAADHGAVIAFCREQAIGLVVIGPEAPLVAGLADSLTAAGIKAFGPSAGAARLEGSKGFTKDLCRRHGIPTAAYACFSDATSAKAHVTAKGAPIVVKADGLAAGKGVTVAMSVGEAHAAIDAIFSGDDGVQVVVEEYLEGEEASFFVLCDGADILPFGTAQDHKRAYDGDIGPNTGGMGAYSPAPVMTEALIARTIDDIIMPTVQGMAQLGVPYRGVLYAGLMLTAEGPKLIEYNARFGDPECQVLMPRLNDDILPLLLATVDGGLSGKAVRWRDETALTVVMAARGYPGGYDKGSRIGGVEAVDGHDGVSVFHAGTALEDGSLIAVGGRVLAVTALGADVAEAQAKAYRAVARIDWPEGFCRSDIGWRALKAG